MKIKQFFLILIALSFLLSVNAQQNANRFALKSGYVEYKISGNSEGLKKVWWDDYGQKSYVEQKSTTSTSLFGITSTEETHTVTVTKDGRFWTANLIDQTGRKGKLPTSQEMLGSDLTEEEQKKLADEILASLGGEKIADEEFMGYSCEVIKIMGSKSWIYKGVVLKSTVSMMGIEVKEEAVAFKPGMNVPSSKFTPASGISYEEMAGEEEYLQEGTLFNISDEDELSGGDDEEGVAALSYSFEKFKTAIEVVKKLGFKKIAVLNEDGTYVSSFMKGFTSMLSISAVSDANIDEEAEDGYKSFVHKGKDCFYMEDGESSVLMVHHSSKNMLVVIHLTESSAQERLLEISDMLNF